ncbi:HAD family hydrolase [Lewinella sp. 4G2]|uniref:HAD family hydrolase n=1 Tax=Lewinella sp. 4G2 TaxID=1803372 RepID=UPI0007B46997|nr:HAD family hydrolase [Lewinella sp. 4G2]OAV45411.1 haloacid dehalogenase [Lewinella sp. 4G2]
MTIPNDLTHIAFDADDTLWGHEHIFVDAKSRCTELLQPYLSPEMDLEKELYRFERKNLLIFGYGVKGFVLSMIETAIELSNGRITGFELQQIIDLGKEMIAHPIELLPYVEEALAQLGQYYTLLIITKGDLFDQENKIARSGIAHHFTHCEIVSEKTAATYADIFRRHQIDPGKLLMIGNSLRSDVLPVMEAGGHAAHLPYKFTWHHERVGEGDLTSSYFRPESLEQLTHQLLAIQSS